jgi:hypothetical protein
MSFARRRVSRRLRWIPHLIRAGREIHRYCIRIRPSSRRQANLLGEQRISAWLRPGSPTSPLVEGQTYHFQGWTIVPTSDGATLTNDATGHGMVIGSDYKVKPF